MVNTLIGRTNDKIYISEKFKIKNKITNDANYISNEFCNFFTNIGQEYADKISKSKFTHNHYMKNKVTKFCFMAPTDPYEITRCIESLKPKKSCGHDCITSILLKHIKQEISHPLSVLINKSFSTGTVPNLLKLAKVIPVYKSKDKQLLNNYRPISLLGGGGG